jgi:hypothetical protein
MGIACTIDVEEYGGATSRVEAVMDGLLGRCADRGVRLTAFVVGDFAREHPELVRRIAAHGHEVGLHGPDHRLLSDWEPHDFIARCRGAIGHLSDLSGSPVTGFRAPVFSLTPDVAWVPAALAESGFTYSSSVVPIRQARGDSGFPGAPREPFRWGCGLVELPSGVYGSWPVGGAYLRLLPRAAVRRMRRGLPKRVPWVYFHPYDFDVDEPRRRLPGTGRVESRLLFARRRLMDARLDDILQGSAAPPLGEQVSELAEHDLPVFEPTGPTGSDQPRRSR